MLLMLMRWMLMLLMPSVVKQEGQKDHDYDHAFAGSSSGS